MDNVHEVCYFNNIPSLRTFRFSSEGHLLRENEVQAVLKSLAILFGTLIPTVSKSEGKVIKPL
jgi:hypothetical protein